MRNFVQKKKKARQLKHKWKEQAAMMRSHVPSAKRGREDERCRERSRPGCRDVIECRVMLSIASGVFRLASRMVYT